YGIEPFPHDLVIPIFAGITGYAIIRHQLMDIRVVIRKSLIYSGLVACMTGLYLMLVIVMERFFQNILGYESIVATAAAGFLIAVFFNPVRGRVQTVIDRALFKATPPELAEQKERFVSEMRKGDQMKAVGTLAAGLAHEIRNPLSSIKTFVEHLESRKSDPEFIAKFQRVVGAEVERINHIVQELLEFAKPQPPRLERVDLPKVIDETLDLMNNELLKRHVEVHRQYGSAAPISGDPQKLRQVFLNLFLNGLEAMNGAGGKLEIGIRSEGTALQVSVRDSGQGIAEKDLPHVREPFFSSKPNGTGLGLAVVEGIIRDHGGKVKINSQPGQGTEVQICLPLKNQLDL
ncbi:MAG TPA: ATP-binding protein, partial [bacterium]